MKNVSIGLAVVILLLLSIFVLVTPPEREAPVEESVATYASDEFGFSLTYRTNPDGYIVSEHTPSAQDDSDLQHVTSFMLKADYEALQASGDVPREGPPTINVAVFANPQHVAPDVWMLEHPYAVNADLAIGEPVLASVAGEKGVRVKTDGLYVTNNVLVAYGDFMYHFSGGFIDETSLIARDFNSFLEAVEWK
ncbi:MAG: hypothetical protein AAB439_03900 [Patescibacteria group bacterium]